MAKKKKGKPEISDKAFCEKIDVLLKKVADFCRENDRVMICAVSQAKEEGEVNVSKFVQIDSHFLGTDALCATAGAIIESIGMARQETTGRPLRHIVLDRAQLAGAMQMTFPAPPNAEGGESKA